MLGVDGPGVNVIVPEEVTVGPAPYSPLSSIGELVLRLGETSLEMNQG